MSEGKGTVARRGGGGAMSSPWDLPTVKNTASISTVSVCAESFTHLQAMSCACAAKRGYKH